MCTQGKTIDILFYFCHMRLEVVSCISDILTDISRTMKKHIAHGNISYGVLWIFWSYSVLLWALRRFPWMLWACCFLIYFQTALHLVYPTTCCKPQVSVKRCTVNGLKPLHDFLLYVFQKNYYQIEFEIECCLSVRSVNGHLLRPTKFTSLLIYEVLKARHRKRS